ncbi:ATP-binding protein [Polynucleobacter sp. 31A-FELB]|uniref:ATP-binding protein n=1 Tax=Polynucleobacter sp. 31A-FELB TaxID=2689096 RepID=UPI0021053A57|nr:ATP-binding protein [Polynucleobacter sp. 31A-FELB]
MSVEPTAHKDNDANPIGLIQLLTSLELASGKAIRGIPAHPRIAQHVFSAHPLLIKHAVEQGHEADRSIRLAFLPHSLNTMVSLTPEALFGRHCAVLGTTGGGKSWTVARLVEEIVRLNGKAILFDATGEFKSLNDGVRHVHLGGQPENAEDKREFVGYPFNQLNESDIFVLFNPTGASQAPKLREALRSLKLAYLCNSLAPNGYLAKINQSKKPVEDALTANAASLDADGVLYNIQLLARQIQEECVYPSANFGKDHTKWGDASNELTYCISLIARIETTLKSPFMACIFKPDGLTALPQVINDFLESKESVLRISMADLPFEHNTRELVTNAIGRYLLRLARTGTFRTNPTVVILDEAHQFLDKSLGDEYSRVSLESFGLIAKEGRKYGLTTLLATQRPRDIPEDVLSQMGMFIVHRLINEKDRQVVEKASGNMDASAAAFLPTLGKGEAIVVGIDSPMPLPVKILAPFATPISEGPQYTNHWKPNRKPDQP